MNGPHRPRSAAPDPRLLDLLANRALGELDPADTAELQHLLLAHPDMDSASFDLTAATLAVAALPAPEPLPQSLRTRLVESAAAWSSQAQAAADRSVAARFTPVVIPGAAAGMASRLDDSDSPRLRSGTLIWTGWLAAAACLLLAALAWLPPSAPSPLSPVALMQTVAAAPDCLRLPWSDWSDPEIKGVQGEVLWSSSQQRGCMVFRGLPANDPSIEQYQLWIVDERGMDQRISGPIFDAAPARAGAAQFAPDGSLIVPIEAKIPVGRAALFALTIEPPGGTWVSSMKRRVVVAARPSS